MVVRTLRSLLGPTLCTLCGPFSCSRLGLSLVPLQGPCGFTSHFMGKEGDVGRVRECRKGEGVQRGFQPDMLRPWSSFLDAPESLACFVCPVSAHGPVGCSWLLGAPSPCSELSFLPFLLHCQLQAPHPSLGDSLVFQHSSYVFI